MGILAVDTTQLHRLLIALRDRPNSGTGVLAVRLRQETEQIGPLLDHARTCGLATRGTFTQVWNVSRLGRQLLEAADREPPVLRAFERMLKGNTGVACS